MKNEKLVELNNQILDKNEELLNKIHEKDKRLAEADDLLLRSKKDMKKFIKQSEPNRNLILEIEKHLNLKGEK